MKFIDDEKLWKIFLKEYLENVVKILPSSYRAQQYEQGSSSVERMLVYEFETKFLKEPFMKAIRQVKARLDKMMRFKVKIYCDSKVVEGIMEITPQWHNKTTTRWIMNNGSLDSVEEIKKSLTKGGRE